MSALIALDWPNEACPVLLAELWIGHRLIYQGIKIGHKFAESRQTVSISSTDINTNIWTN